MKEEACWEVERALRLSAMDVFEASKPTRRLVSSGNRAVREMSISSFCRRRNVSRSMPI